MPHAICTATHSVKSLNAAIGPHTQNRYIKININNIQSCGQTFPANYAGLRSAIAHYLQYVQDPYAEWPNFFLQIRVQEWD